MKSLLKLTGLLIAGLVLVGKVHASAATGMNVIEGSKHDFTLSYNGGAVGAAVSQCSTCHEMHKPVKMMRLWARNNPDATLNWKVKSSPYFLPTEYTNAAFDANPIVASTAAGSLIPKAAFTDSRSGLCLSCHDGTQAVSDGGMITGRANLTIAPGDLSQNHRIGNERVQVSYRDGVTTTLSDAVLKAGDAVSITNVNGVVKTRYFVGCTTCHSMHSSPMENRKLLVNARDIGHGPVCWDCHGGK